MNDRASAAPPVAFLGLLAPAERAALERPAVAGDDGARCVGGGTGGEAAQKTQQGRRKALLGQVWEGVRGRLRLRRDGGAGEDGRKKQAEGKKPQEDKEGERPSREDVLANYHQLVASGFFSSHAIHSTRPPGTRPSTSHDARPHPHQHRQHHDAGSSSSGNRPQWPLAPLTPPASRVSPVCSPASGASSRGTKRTAAEHDEDDDADADADAEHDGGDGPPPPDEDASTLAHRFLPKRLRSSASRDISLPKLRRITSRRALAAAGRRSISMADAPPSAAQPTKRVPGASFAGVGGAARCSLEVSSLRGRAAGDAAAPSLRAPRPRASAEPLSVVPDANRGIPRVPAIPAKFTYGQDRENAGPWRGLRR